MLNHHHLPCFSTIVQQKNKKNVYSYRYPFVFGSPFSYTFYCCAQKNVGERRSALSKVSLQNEISAVRFLRDSEPTPFMYSAVSFDIVAITPPQKRFQKNKKYVN